MLLPQQDINKMIYMHLYIYIYRKNFKVYKKFQICQDITKKNTEYFMILIKKTSVFIPLRVIVTE